MSKEKFPVQEKAGDLEPTKRLEQIKLEAQKCASNIVGDLYESHFTFSYAARNLPQLIQLLNEFIALAESDSQNAERVKETQSIIRELREYPEKFKTFTLKREAVAVFDRVIDLLD